MAHFSPGDLITFRGTPSPAVDRAYVHLDSAANVIDVHLPPADETGFGHSSAPLQIGRQIILGGTASCHQIDYDTGVITTLVPQLVVHGDLRQFSRWAQYDATHICVLFREIPAPAASPENYIGIYDQTGTLTYRSPPLFELDSPANRHLLPLTLGGTEFLYVSTFQIVHYDIATETETAGWWESPHGNPSLYAMDSTHDRQTLFVGSAGGTPDLGRLHRIDVPTATLLQTYTGFGGTFAPNYLALSQDERYVWTVTHSAPAQGQLKRVDVATGTITTYTDPAYTVPTYEMEGIRVVGEAPSTGAGRQHMYTTMLG